MYTDCTLSYLEENCIVCKELGQVAVSQGSDEDQVFLDIRVLSLQLTCHHQHLYWDTYVQMYDVHTCK